MVKKKIKKDLERILDNKIIYFFKNFVKGGILVIEKKIILKVIERRGKSWESLLNLISKFLYILKFKIIEKI